MHIAIVTAGGAGMFCGSCMHDNTWARALIKQGIEVSLIPTYTPLRVDEPDQSLRPLFLGGVNVYLNGKLNWWRHVPRSLTSWLDHPRLIEMASRWSVSNDAAELGDLTISMLRGENGPHRDAIRQLARFISKDLQPDIIIFSNALLSGALHEIQQQWPVPAICVLQGDDVFLDSLPQSYRKAVVQLVTQRAERFSRYLVHSEFYREYMSDYLSLPISRFATMPLGIDYSEHTGRPDAAKNSRFTVGYFARICPEKGFHHLADAMVLLKKRIPEVRLHFGGYQQASQKKYLDESLRKLTDAGVEFRNFGSPETAAEKAAFLQTLDVLSVPTEFLEPKGMSVLEALANGVPVVQPAHGAFPEMLGSTGGGLLVPPRSPEALAQGLEQMTDPVVRLHHAEQGWQGVREHYSLDRMVARTLQIVHEVIGDPQRSGELPVKMAR